MCKKKKKKIKNWGREDKTSNVARGSSNDFKSILLLKKVRQEAGGRSYLKLASVDVQFFQFQNLLLTWQSWWMKSGVKSYSQFKCWNNLCGIVSFGGPLNPPKDGKEFVINSFSGIKNSKHRFREGGHRWEGTPILHYSHQSLTHFCQSFRGSSWQWTWHHLE